MTSGAETNIAIIMLSAGTSSRMGQPKQLLPWKGKNLLQHCLDQVLGSLAGEVVLVLGAHHDKIHSEIDRGRAEVVVNADWGLGMSTSIQAGMKFLDKTGRKYSGILFCLSDQPLLDFRFYNQLIKNFISNSNKIICSEYDKGYGVPAIFPSNLFSQLRALKGDKGAKALIQQNLNRVLSVDASGLVDDLDTLEQYKRMFEAHGQ